MKLHKFVFVFLNRIYDYWKFWNKNFIITIAKKKLIKKIKFKIK